MDESCDGIILEFFPLPSININKIKQNKADMKRSLQTLEQKFTKTVIKKTLRNIDISKYPTISSLAFAIYRSNWPLRVHPGGYPEYLA